MKAIVLAGGKGSRLAPYTKVFPKPLMPIGDMPILEIIVRKMKHAGIEDVILAVGHLSELFRAFFLNGERFGLRISYSCEDRPLGTAGPLSLVEGLNETFLVTNGDVLTTLKFESLLEFHKRMGAVATIAMHNRKVKINLGVIQSNGGGQVKDYIEKPTYDFQVSMGIYVFEPKVLSYIDYNQFFDFPDLVKSLIVHREPVFSFPFDGYWEDLGNPEDYARAVEQFEKLRPQILGDTLHEFESRFV